MRMFHGVPCLLECILKKNLLHFLKVENFFSHRHDVNGFFGFMFCVNLQPPKNAGKPTRGMPVDFFITGPSFQWEF